MYWVANVLVFALSTWCNSSAFTNYDVVEVGIHETAAVETRMWIVLSRVTVKLFLERMRTFKKCSSFEFSWKRRCAEIATKTSIAVFSKSPVYLRFCCTGRLKCRSSSLRNRFCFVVIHSNAIKFTSEGTVEVHAECLNRDEPEGQATVRVSVIDSGCGIPVKDQTKLFQPFVQLSTGAQKAAGTGTHLPHA